MFTALQNKTIVIAIFCIWNVSNSHAMDPNYSRLQLACLAGDEQKVVQHIKEGDDVNIKRFSKSLDDSGCFKQLSTPLHCAAEKGYSKIMKLLFDAKVDRNSTHCEFDATPLHTAVWFEKPECVETLMQHGADPLIPNSDGNTPVHLAAFNGNLSCLEKLLKPDNIQLNFKLCATKNKKGQTPLDLAIMTESTTVSQRLQKTIGEIIWVCTYLELLSEYALFLEQQIPNTH